ncbi:hypothetical protein C3L33_12978, partial [Rhododendron williamsianum]
RSSLINYPSEYITGISGCWSGICNLEQRQINSITFTTNNRTYGPFGSVSRYGTASGVTDFGKAWDDGRKEKIVQIFIAHEDFIYSLQFLNVDQNGNLVLSDLHGRGFALPSLM